MANSGLELVYDHPVADSKHGPAKSSFVLYKSEYGAIQLLARHHSELTGTQRKQRDDQLRRSYHPGLGRRLRRRMRNTIHTIRDAVNEVFVLLLGRVKQMDTAKVVGRQEKYILRTQKGLAEHVMPASCDMLLEKFIGGRVIVECQRNGEMQEIEGVLKEYTADYLALMDVDYRRPFEQHGDLAAEAPAAPGPGELDDPAQGGIEIHRQEAELVIANRGRFPVQLASLVLPRGEQKFVPPVEIAPGAEHRVALAATTEEKAPEEITSGETTSGKVPPVSGKITVRLVALRHSDVLLPRSRALVRHRVAATAE